MLRPGLKCGGLESKFGRRPGSHDKWNGLVLFVPGCGGINPYTLMAGLGPARTRGSSPLEDDTLPGQSVRSPGRLE